MEIQEVVSSFLMTVSRESWMTLLTVFVLGVAYNVHFFNQEKKRPKRIAVLEDSDNDFLLFKHFFHLNNIVIDRYKTADDLPFHFALHKPDMVIADYYLEGSITGDAIIALCNKLRIPAKLITGYTGDIEGVESSRIVRKSIDGQCYLDLQHWAEQYV